MRTVKNKQNQMYIKIPKQVKFVENIVFRLEHLHLDGQMPYVG